MKVSIPSSFSNPIVLIIPKDESAITTEDAKVSIYYIDIDFHI